MEIDVELFEQHIFEPESAFEILLRGHLWIENLIQRIIEINIVNAGVLDLDRMGFRQKIDIAQAFGFINPEIGNAFKALNRLRNKLAHDLMAEPSESEVNHLVSVLSGPTKAAFDAVTRHPDVAPQLDKLAILRYWLIGYIMELDYILTRINYKKDNHVKLAQVAGARFGAKMFGGKELSEEEARAKYDLDPPPVLDEMWISVIDRNYNRRKNSGTDSARMEP
jgi:hypothetical protein